MASVKLLEIQGALGSVTSGKAEAKAMRLRMRNLGAMVVVVVGRFFLWSEATRWLNEASGGGGRLNGGGRAPGWGEVRVYNHMLRHLLLRSCPT